MHSVYTIWTMNRTLSGDNTLEQSVPGSNGNEGVVHVPSNRQGRSLIIWWLNDISKTFVVGILPLCSNAVGVYWSPSQMGWYMYIHEYIYLSIITDYGEIVVFSKCDKMIKISGQVDKSNIYKEFNYNILFLIQGRTSSD